MPLLMKMWKIHIWFDPTIFINGQFPIPVLLDVCVGWAFCRRWWPCRCIGRNDGFDSVVIIIGGATRACSLSFGVGQFSIKVSDKESDVFASPGRFNIVIYFGFKVIPERIKRNCKIPKSHSYFESNEWISHLCFYVLWMGGWMKEWITHLWLSKIYKRWPFYD